MQQPHPPGRPAYAAPSFSLIDRQPPRLGAVALAVLVAGCGLTLVALGLGHAGKARAGRDSSTGTRTTSGGSSPAPKDDDKDDDPNQVDTIVLGDAADAPVPARRGDHVSPVHATVIVQLPRFGRDTGLIPDSPSGHLLFAWLAAFNQGSFSALETALPNAAPAAAAAAQMEVRAHTGGYNLLSAKEVQPGVLVFRMRDQTPEGNEVLGTLQVRPDSKPPVIASFSLREIPAAAPKSAKP